jgi:hypothetical protein
LSLQRGDCGTLARSAIQALEVNQKPSLIYNRNADVPFVFLRLDFAGGCDFLRVCRGQTRFLAHSASLKNISPDDQSVKHCMLARQLYITNVNLENGSIYRLVWEGILTKWTVRVY